ncbi:FadR/GntR family transcriptional regulator [Leucobacter sp. USHLN153]|uniref:FadR/GntR family transcriptional regulator n=1 Tax=Leucobacter sp. USHLN153 TaxID=3081268 RepID=UPI00301AD49C
MHQPLLAAPVPSGDSDVVAGQQAGGIAQRIAGAISGGMLTVGERLPPEAELASQFGIAVATLRKALATLRAQGVVETRRGRNGGTFVVRAPFPSSSLLLSSLERISIVTLRDIADEHSAISGMSARLAAERTEPNSRTRLAELAFRAREARTAHELSMSDGRFHVEIAVLSHSQRLLTAEQRLQAELGPFLWCEDIARASAQLAFTEHLALIMAIEQQRADDAQRLAVAHVRSNISLIIEGKLRLIAGGHHDIGLSA